MNKKLLALLMTLILAIVPCTGMAEQPPEPPQGGAPGDMPARPDGDMPGQPPEGGPGPGGFGAAAEGENGTAATLLTEDAEITDASYASAGDDENALRISGATVSLTNITVDKSGGESSNTESGDFYGMNAGLLAQDGAQVTIDTAEVTTNARNGNGVFSYGQGTSVTILNSTITTQADNSGGIQTTGGAEMHAYGLTVETSGNSSAAIRSDRGGGTVEVEGGSYTSHGTGSPAIYSTADISVSGAALNATASEAVVVEGKNSVTLNDCDVSGNMAGTYQGDASENIHNVMLYQSMSGDADVGESSFAMTGGTLTANAGDMFYVTNTDSVISLENVSLTLANGKLLTVEGNDSARGWGTAGANGANVTFNAQSQILAGDITVDEISTLKLSLTEGACLTGSISIVENTAGGEIEGDNIAVSIGEGCTWCLTGDSVISTLENAGTIEFNGHTITLADGTVLAE